MVTGNGSTTTQPSDPTYLPSDPHFGLSKYFNYETDDPWLYLKLPAAPTSGSPTHSSILTKWYYIDPVLGAVHKEDISGGANDLTTLDFWFTPADWDTIKIKGEWKVDATYNWLNNGNAVKRTGTGSVHFLTPEPVSMSLFGLGAGVLGLTRLRKKKKSL